MARITEILPLEIIEEIIALLPNSDHSVSTKLTSLQACSLVCQAFVPLCQKHIFHSVTFVYTAEKLSFVKLVNENSRILDYVRSIFYMVAPEDFQLQTACPISFVDVLRSFTKPETVMVSFQYGRQDWKKLSDIMRSVVLSLIHKPSVSSVGLANICEFDYTTLLQCANVQELRLQNVVCAKWDFSSTSTPTSASIKPRLLEMTHGIEVLNMHYDVGTVLLDLAKLKHIELGPGPLFPAADILKNVKTLESALVSISLSRAEDSEVFVSLMTGSSKTLKRLTLKSSYLTLTGNYSGFLSNIGDVLKKLSGRNIISTLTIELDAIFGRESPSTIGEEWNIFDQILLTPGWPSLREFNLAIYDSRGDIVKQALRSLPETHLHGLASSEIVSFNLDVVRYFSRPVIGSALGS